MVNTKRIATHIVENEEPPPARLHEALKKFLDPSLVTQASLYTIGIGMRQGMKNIEDCFVGITSCPTWAKSSDDSNCMGLLSFVQFSCESSISLFRPIDSGVFEVQVAQVGIDPMHESMTNAEGDAMIEEALKGEKSTDLMVILQLFMITCPSIELTKWHHWYKVKGAPYIDCIKVVEKEIQKRWCGNIFESMAGEGKAARVYLEDILKNSDDLSHSWVEKIKMMIRNAMIMDVLRQSIREKFEGRFLSFLKSSFFIKKNQGEALEEFLRLEHSLQKCRGLS